jgi:hypothetical protein
MLIKTILKKRKNAKAKKQQFKKYNNGGNP